MAKVVQHMEGLHGRQSDFLAFSTLLSVVEKSPPLEWIGVDATLAATCELMKQHHFISIPVYDEGKRRIVGMADILDICAYLCWGSTNLLEASTETSLEEIKRRMSEVSVMEVLKAKQRPPSECLVIKRNLDSVISLLDLMAQGLHRALVRVWPEDEDEEGQLLEHYRLAAQIDLVRFLVEHKLNLNHHLIYSSVQALGMVGPAPTLSPAKTLIYSTKEGKTALEAFRKLAVSGVHAIGITGAGTVGGQPQHGEAGRLLYNLSASDLRGITPDTVHLLREPVEVFLARVEESDPTRPKNLVTCFPDATLFEVMELVLRSHVHRVWVVDQQHRPVGLITLTDILSKFASFDYAGAQAAGKKTIVPLSHSHSWPS
jgi:CBS domain-containing protein